MDKNRKFASNPFAKSLLTESRQSFKSETLKTQNDMMLVNKNTGECSGVSTIIKRRQVEKNEFIKIYAKGASVLLSLGSAGTKIFALIIANMYGLMNKNQDKILISYNSLPKEIQEVLCEKTFKRGISECIKADVIAKTLDNNVYYLNPTYIFNGDRLRLVNEYEMISESELEFNASLIPPTKKSWDF